ncbi:uncharacterized protein Z519_11774 [Cladophialophora bantiana CBS 173.52]|uniref:AB hydrolase-1 domain-containing protein n=1 Tax=Cladophialophora bantiana (strain ATCC 10958 / CBS 173.52 / CDC B-1940 / NIH 8579) TaxID=1442370 RepID=A0A0D2HA61_CLAB1|nr:uncharacterized protein Z519_11774 [Cladophialophora bantiana CBS 173.52]KIW87800.1 hypothetical protein Z519_11774 [Cladophialophora bantiana CBS 173.52]
MQAATRGKIITHPNGQTTHLIIDNFTDPWLPCETILIQHGFARHAAFWYHWVPALARKYRVIRRDTRGHGYSSTPDERTYDYSFDTICEEIVDTLDQLGIRQVHFLGELTSGMVGEFFACKHAERVKSLIICSSPTFLPPKALSLFAFGHKDWPTACHQVGVSSAEGLAGYAKFLSSLDSRGVLSQIKVPMLILAPAKSAATKLEEQRGIKQTVEQAQLEVINGKGHEIYGEMPGACQQSVLTFLSQIK